MSRATRRPNGPGQLVQEHFHADSRFWRDVYTQDTLNGAIYRERLKGVLGFVDGLNLPFGAQVLDAGCGAGPVSVALAKRAFRVEAVDVAPEMLLLTRRAAETNEVTGLVNVSAGDIHQLGLPGDCFDLAVAVGVMEWLPSYAGPLGELYRVLRPGGWLIANVDNSRALHCLIDPRMNPLASRVKRLARRMAERVGLLEPLARPSRCSRAKFDLALHAAGFQKVDSLTSGFGPFTVLGVRLFPEGLAVRLHNAAQSVAFRRVPFFRNGGDTYLVLVRKPRLVTSQARNPACLVG